MNSAIFSRGVGRALCWALGVGFCFPALSRGDGDESNLLEKIFHRDLQVIAVTDMTDAGRKLTPASKDHPVYYEALVKGYNDWGSSVAGERIPDKKAMVRLIMKVLADQGYYPANRLHKPEILLAFAWGSMNGKFGMSLAFMGGEKLDLMWEVDPYIGGLLDPRVLTRNMRSPEAATIMSCAGSDLYVASVQAFDEQAALNGDTVLLWHTKITCPASGLAMDSSLRGMIHAAGPFFGRETARPSVITRPLKKASVDIGEIKALEEIDTSKLPITDRTDDKGRSSPH